MALETTTFTQNIKKLLTVEDEIQLLQDQLKELRKQKQKSEEEIMRTMIERNWHDRSIDVGKYILSIAEKKHYSSMSYSYLEKTLSQIIPDKAQIEYVMKYLKDHRELKIRHEVVFANKD
jgi:hypothetical protein